MALNKQQGTNQARDGVAQRIGSGTLGTDFVQTGGISGKKIASIIDDSDPRIIYATVSGNLQDGSITNQATNNFVSGGTQTILGGVSGVGVVGTSASYTFTGNSIGVLGALSMYSGKMRVYIDGSERAGKTALRSSFRIGYLGNYSAPVLGLDDTFIPAYGFGGSSSTPGKVYIEGEIISYTSYDTNGFYGCVRGIDGTQAKIHLASETIYEWASVVNCSLGTGGVVGRSSLRQVLWYNPMLAPGQHTITIKTEAATSTYAKIYFDGFIQGTLLGNKNILTQFVTYTWNIYTDANGHAELGYLSQQSTDSAIIGMLGYTQDTAEASNTVPVGRLMMRFDPNTNQPYLSFHNGPGSSSVWVTAIFSLIGESL